MGLIICKKHGTCSINELCSHAADIINNGGYQNFYRLTICGTLILCKDCYINLNFEKFQQSIACPNEINESILNAYFEAYSQIEDRQVICAECVAEANVKQARKNGEADPFPVYEQTLTGNHSEQLDLLKTHLTRNFNFPLSTRWDLKNKPAIFIYAGNYREPVSIRVYYITKTNEQDYVISLVENFFSDLKLNQVKITFYEEEVWKTFHDQEQGTTTHTMGKECLLREVFINCV